MLWRYFVLLDEIETLIACTGLYVRHTVCIASHYHAQILDVFHLVMYKL